MSGGLTAVGAILLHQTPGQIVEPTIDEDADVVGLSVLSGAHMTLVPASSRCCVTPRPPMSGCSLAERFPAATWNP